MAIIHINNIRIAGIAAGVPRNIVKTVSKQINMMTKLTLSLLE